MHVKLLEAIAKFLENEYITFYTLEGYYGFAYLTIENVVWKFELIGDEVIIKIKE